MPEGPEIRQAADKVADAIVGKPAKEVFFAFDHLKTFEEALAGVVVSAVNTYGKAMLTRFENGLNIYTHNQLYGVWKVRQAYRYPETNRQLRLAIHNDKKSALLYSASDIEVLADTEIEGHPFISRIGPDLLDESVTLEQVEARFLDNKFKRRGLISLLLDQSFLAGLGNYLRSEILYVARVHPSKRPIDCTPEEIHALATAALELTRQSYRMGGITNDLALVDELKAKGQGYYDYRYWIFGRENRACYVCGTPIVKEKMGGRRLYFCHSCQSEE